MAFCHAVTQGQQGWSSYGSRTTHIRVGKKRRYCMNSPALQAPPKTSFGCRKGGAFLHGSTPCWCRQTCEPSEWVSEEYVCAPMLDDGRRGSLVLAPFRTVSPETRALSRREHGLFFGSACESPSRTYRACPSQDRRVYALCGICSESLDGACAARRAHIISHARNQITQRRRRDVAFRFQGVQCSLPQRAHKFNPTLLSVAAGHFAHDYCPAVRVQSI